LAEKDAAPAGLADSLEWRQANDLAFQAGIFMDQREWARARDALGRAIEIFDKVGDHRQAAASVGALGDVALMAEGNLAAAVNFYEESIARARTISDTEIEVLGLRRASALYSLADPEIAEAYERRAHELDPEGKYQAPAANPALPPDAPAVVQPDDSTISPPSAPVQNEPSTGDAVADVIRLTFEADLERSQFKLLSARTKFEHVMERIDALALIQRSIVGAFLLGTLQGLAEIALLLGEPQKAVAYGQRALDILREDDAGGPAALWLDDDSGTAARNVARSRSHDLLGRCRLLLGAYELAEGHLQQALTFAKAAASVPVGGPVHAESLHAVGMCADGMGFFYVDQGQPDRALDHLQVALDAFIQLDDKRNLSGVHLDMANALMNRAQSRASTQADGDSKPGVSEQAASHLRAALDLARATGARALEASVLATQGRLLLNYGWTGEGSERLRQAAQLHELDQDAASLVLDQLNLSDAYDDLKMPVVAVAAADRALELAEKNDLPDFVWKAEWRLGHLVTTATDREAPYRHFRAAADAVDRMRTELSSERFQVAFFEDKEGIYQDLAKACFDLGKPDEAFDAVERSKARAFVDMLRYTSVHAPETIDAQLLHEESRQMDRIRALTASIPQVEGEQRITDLEALSVARRSLDQVLDSMKIAAPEYVALRRGDHFSLGRIREVLPPGIVLIEYFIAGDTLLVFAVRHDSERPAVIDRPLDEKALRRFVGENFGSSASIKQLIEFGLDQRWHAFDWLVAPIAEWAAPGEIVVLVPHGVLHYLPLHALRLADGYLIERNPVSYSPSASVLGYCLARQGRKANASANPIAVLADARGDLPYARAEAYSVAHMFDIEPLVGAGVTREAFRSAILGARDFHVAGHARFDSSQPLESGLALAGDAVFTAGEVFQLPALPTQLVTLSGCQSGVNERRPGDELIGLTRAFLYAGSPSVIVSQWRVDDESTGSLMGSFYSSIRSGTSPSKAHALRDAMLAVKAKPQWSSWYHWAPFVLVGDWN
jgi:CHAT domain-containing protein/tetratricopeptide (TPR) repeat protein